MIETIPGNMLFDLYITSKGFKNRKTETIPEMFARIEAENRRKKEIDNKNPTLNSNFSEYYKQGNIGDCYLIAAILSISNSHYGERILKNAIKKDYENGTFSVTLRGVNKTYTFSMSVLNKYKKLSKGDSDVKAVELAIAAYQAEMKNEQENKKCYRRKEYYNFDDFSFDAPIYRKSQENLIEGNSAAYVTKLLTGADTQCLEVNDNITKLKYKMSNGQVVNFVKCFKKNPEDFIVTIGPILPKDKSSYDLRGELRKKHKGLIPNHAYSLKRIEDDGIVLTNPWNSKDSFKVKFDELGKYVFGINITEAENTLIEPQTYTDEYGYKVTQYRNQKGDIVKITVEENDTIVSCWERKGKQCGVKESLPYDYKKIFDKEKLRDTKQEPIIEEYKNGVEVIVTKNGAGEIIKKVFWKGFSRLGTIEFDSKTKEMIYKGEPPFDELIDI